MVARKQSQSSVGSSELSFQTCDLDGCDGGDGKPDQVALAAQRMRDLLSQSLNKAVEMKIPPLHKYAEIMPPGEMYFYFVRYEKG